MFSLIYKLILIFQVNYVFGFRADTFLEEFCDCHENEIDKIEAQCNTKLEIQVSFFCSFILTMINFHYNFCF
jgi:hypothetical protein